MAKARKRKGDPVHGWLNLVKPEDMTSTQAVGLAKRLFNARKAGHGGTLDPLADGVLPIAFGEATKTVAWTMEAEKEYVFTIRWGVSTTSQDREGEATGRSDARPSPGEIEAALGAFEGEIEQIPPKFSAVKVAGERAYDLAREGETFELEARPALVHEVSLRDAPDADHAVIHVRCGKGFYVRALARDLAAALGAEGHVSRLSRTRVGPFRIETGATPDALEAAADMAARLSALHPVQAPLDDVPALAIDTVQAGQLKQGRDIALLPHVMEEWRARTAARAQDDRAAIAMCGDMAVALGEVRAGRFQPSRVFQL